MRIAKSILLWAMFTWIASCGSSSSSSGFSQTFTSSASIGELVSFSIDTSNNTYSFTITQSSFGLTGTTGSGTLIANSDGSYSPSTQTYSKIYAVKNGLLIGSINLTISGTLVNVPIYGTSSPITSISSLAGTYNYISSSCANNTSGSGCGSTSYGTIKVDALGNYTQCTTTNITSTPACSDTTGTLTYLGSGVWNYQRTGSSNTNYFLGFNSSNGQNVLIIDLNDSGGYGYGQAVASTQSALDTSGTNDGTWFLQTNQSQSAVTTVSGNAYSTVNYYSDGRTSNTDTGIITADTPWTGMFTNTGTTGTGIGILSGTGLFVSKSSLAGYESYYFFGLKK